MRLSPMLISRTGNPRMRTENEDLPFNLRDSLTNSFLKLFPLPLGLLPLRVVGPSRVFVSFG